MFNHHKLHLTCFYSKIFKLKAPAYLHDRLTYRTDVHNLNIRRKNILTVPLHHKEIFKRSFSYNIAAHLNNLDATNFNISVKSFKGKYKNILLGNQ